jgi:putative ribosome biogenesis GTPase RsgA
MKEGKMQNNLVTKAVEAIYQMDNDQLNQVIEAVKLKRNHIAKQAVRKFLVGDKVSFIDRNKRRTHGIVEKVNKKYIIVDTNPGPKWRIPGNMLEKESA